MIFVGNNLKLLPCNSILQLFTGLYIVKNSYILESLLDIL